MSPVPGVRPVTVVEAPPSVRLDPACSTWKLSLLTSCSVEPARFPVGIGGEDLAGKGSGLMLAFARSPGVVGVLPSPFSEGW